MMCVKDDFGQYIDRTAWYNINLMELNNIENCRLWLNRNYCDILCRIALERNPDLEDIDHEIELLSKRYGEIMLPKYLEGKKLMYSDQFGLVVLYKD